MLWIIFVILLVLWLAAGYLLHAGGPHSRSPVIALVIALVKIFAGARR